MNEIKKVEQSLPDELLAAFKEMPQARTDYTLRELVIGTHETIEQQYAHTILELRTTYGKLRRARISLEKIDYQMEEYSKKAESNELFGFKLREKEIDKYELECAIIGTLREFNCLYKIYKSFPKKFTRKEVNANQKEYWKRRAVKQANQDIIATGRVKQGNQGLLEDIGKPLSPVLDHVRDVEHKYIEGENSNTKVMIAVPVARDIPEEEQEGGIDLPCIKGLIIPAGIQVKYYVSHGRKVAAAYNDIVREFLADGADYLLTIEDDTFPPEDALVKLLHHIADGKKVVGAWYMMRNGTGDGVPIAINDKGKRGQLPADDKVYEVYTLPMGCSFYAAEVFYKIEQPWFETTDCLSQDSFFSQKLRDAGYTLYCDTSIRCKHIDRVTSKVYE